jgi:hypothetical protein
VVRYINDPTGRFPRRPFYEDEEFEDECDSIIAAYYRRRGMDVPFPIPTDDLTKLMETRVETLDLYADLSADIDGRTDFNPLGETTVSISVELTESSNHENRLRTTLTHELAHVHFHEPLFRAKALQPSLFEDSVETSTSCHRSNIIEPTDDYDWLEWQAGFASTAMLMPRWQLVSVVRRMAEATGANTPMQLGTPAGSHLIRLVQESFQVSGDAARVRLLRLGYVLPHGRANRCLFPPRR